MARSSSSPLRFHEGQACDLVLREIERRTGLSRKALRSPEADGDPDPVDFAVDIGGITYAVEHTGIEPFAGHIHFSAQGGTHIDPIIAAVQGRLPTEDHYELQLPLGVLQGLRGYRLRSVQRALADLVVGTAPALRRAPAGRYITPVSRLRVPGAEFTVVLHRLERWANQPPFSISHVVDSSLEAQREQRLWETCDRKFGKLAAWRRKANARAVLVLEQNDIQLTNPEVVWIAYERAEQRFEERPDEVWLVVAVVDDMWWGVPLRVDGQDYYEAAVHDRWPEYRPADLEDLSGIARRG